MHKLTEKKGKKTVTHYFHHVKERDGSKKHVYLGTHPEKSKERLNKLKVARIESNNRLIQDLDTVQSKLDRLGHYDKPYDDILQDVRKRYYAEKHFDSIVEKRHKSNSFMYAISFFTIALSLAAIYLIWDVPSITGAAVEVTKEAAKSTVVSSIFFMTVAVLIFVIIVGGAVYLHEHRHDKYKPRNMLE